MAKSNNPSIERILTEFLDEFHQGKILRLEIIYLVTLIEKKSLFGN